ncbi:metallophosphoesterase [Streptomyces californicus]|uniref:Metallophosphoesterase n=1 Tax=Streptomyces californicus TaxID=67351 RepID=A0ABD7CVM9_9ACTN|nr:MULTISPECIES: metallophosphoesterase [Streptomyces]QRV29046.1 metallophosphoesterase [Streptomyces californicus]QRV35349.1 metallophosphoesterase [Streptomyces californicus]QRV42460.1 metallophosphoesterase [Streptomyces californicus]QRV49141.1 metallophosphoesterase [Streptomyces californicus]
MVRVPFRAAADRVRRRLGRIARPSSRSRTAARTPAAAPGDLAAAGRGPGRHPYLRALGMLAVVVLGAWLGLLAVGSIRTPVGPMDTTMTLRPSLTGGSKINVSPLGALELDSHIAPLRLDVDVDRLDPERSQALVDQPERFSNLQDEVTRDVAAGTRELAVRSCVAVVSGAAALGLVVYRRPRRALAAGGLALTLLAASGVSAYATWNPKSVLEPKFSGLLSSAPSLVGDARSIVTEFDIYQRELARLVTNVTKLYDATSTLPVYQPDPGTIRVLHVSDIHLNPAAWHIIASLVEQYEIDVIVDSGDTMDHGSAAENGFLDPIRDLGAPYVWVRGNHDSRGTQEYLEKFRNVRVLDDGAAVNVGGLRIAGTGDASFTPDRTGPGSNKEAARLEGMRLATALRDQERAGTPADIAVAHDPNTARETDGTVPLVLSGHYHRRINEQLKLGTRLKVEGSTGGGGLRAVQNEKPEKVHASVLYMDRSTRRLQAWDEITLGGLGLTTAEVSRHLPEENLKKDAPGSPTPSPYSPSSSASPAPSPGRSSGRPTPAP